MIEEIQCEDQGVLMIGRYISVVSVGVVVAPDSGVVAYMMGILFIQPIRLRVSLVNLSRSLFILLIEDSLILETTQVRIVVSL